MNDELHQDSIALAAKPEEIHREDLARAEAERDHYFRLYGQESTRLEQKCGELTLALARVEAERELLRDQCQSYIRTGNEVLAERDAAQAQLAEAVGLLRDFAEAELALQDPLSNAQLDASISRLLVAGESVRDFLARHAQAEKQEARNAEVARESLRLENQRIKQVEPLRVPHPLEAQGAHDIECACQCCVPTVSKCINSEIQNVQAGDERKAFEKTRNPHTLRRNEVGDYVLPSVQDAWSGWQARATQPAAGDTVYQYMRPCGEWADCERSFYEYQKRLGYTVRIYHPAPSAAAHGDEAVRWVPCSERLPEIGNGGNQHFLVSVFRAQSGESSVFEAHFLLDYPLYNESLGDETGEYLATGWFNQVPDIEFDEYYEPVVRKDSGDEVTHWMPMPAPAAMRAQGDGGAKV